MLQEERWRRGLVTRSGDSGGPRDGADTILWRTLDECAQNRLIILEDINDSVCRVSVTALGRLSLK